VHCGHVTDPREYVTQPIETGWRELFKITGDHDEANSQAIGQSRLWFLRAGDCYRIRTARTYPDKDAWQYVAYKDMIPFIIGIQPLARILLPASQQLLAADAITLDDAGGSCSRSMRVHTRT